MTTHRPEPRIPPIKPSEWTEEVKDIFAILGGPEQRERGPVYDIIAVFCQHPALAKPFLHYSGYLLVNSILPDRARELVVLYAGWTCKSVYEWASHLREGLRNGAINDADIEAIKQGPDCPHWTDLERNLLKAVDQMRDTHSLDDELWSALSREFDRRQMMELLFVIGTYIMLSGVVNGLRIPPEAGNAGEDLVEKYGAP